MELLRKAVQGRVNGRVQGVGYRYYAQDAAWSLGLSGWVRNTADRSVEFFAQGYEDDLKTFVDRLRQGPPMARVQDVVCTDEPFSDSIREFEIRH